VRAKKFQKYTMLQITWEDIIDDTAWRTHENSIEAETCLVKTLGYHIANKGKNIIIAHSFTEDGENDTMVIPFGVIQSIEVIEVK
jgi:hypothetical protein